MSRFEHLASQLTQLEESGRLRELVPRQIDGPYLVLPDGRRLVNFGGNDYLGLASVHRSRGSSGSGASPLVCGWTLAHQRLADTIAEFESTESAVLFPSGFAACMGTISTLAQDDDLILSDQRNHASLIDGCRLSRAKRVLYRHRDCGDLEASLARCRGDFHHVWIVTDGVFSMDGHIAPLQQLSQIASRYDANLIVDEAHGTGVLGATGSGACESLGVKEDVAIRIGTLSKAVGSQGGFVAGPKVVTDFLINRCRTLIYSTALAPAAVLAAEEAIRSIRSSPERRDRLHRFSRRLRSELGIHVEAPEDGVPIVPLVIGEDVRAVELSGQLADAGFYVPAIRPPTVAEGTARLRFSLSTLHEESMLDSLIETLSALDLCRGLSPAP